MLPRAHQCHYQRYSSIYTLHTRVGTRVYAHVLHVYNVECIFFVARGFVVHTRAIKQSQHTGNVLLEQTRHECMLS